MTKLRFAIISLIVLDIFCVMMHLLFGQDKPFFNLDGEQNFPAIYQGVKLILIGSFGIFHLLKTYYLKRDQGKQMLLFWLPFVLLFIFIGVDEIGQIHENIGPTLEQFFPNTVGNYREFFSANGFNSAEWLIFYVPMFFIGLLYFAWTTYYFRKQYRNKVWFIILGFAFFLSVPVFEFVGTLGGNPGTSIYNLLVIGEETAEMLGATVFFYFIAKVVREDIVSIKERLKD